MKSLSPNKKAIVAIASIILGWLIGYNISSLITFALAGYGVFLGHSLLRETKINTKAKVLAWVAVVLGWALIVITGLIVILIATM